jgi:hypothetical protein
MVLDDADLIIRRRALKQFGDDYSMGDDRAPIDTSRSEMRENQGSLLRKNSIQAMVRYSCCVKGTVRVPQRLDIQGLHPKTRSRMHNLGWMNPGGRSTNNQLKLMFSGTGRDIFIWHKG